MGLCQLRQTHAIYEQRQTRMEPPLQMVPVSSILYTSFTLLTFTHSTFRTLPRTMCCEDFASDPIKRLSSNFTSHARECKKRPAEWDGT